MGLIPTSRVTIVRSASPTATVPIVIARPTSTTGPAMTLSLSGLPAGVTPAFSAATTTGHAVTLTLSVSGTTPLGAFPLVLTATGAGQNITAPMILVVSQPGL
jgi:hypothetical protein